MISIERATVADAAMLSTLGTQTFIESHGNSAAQEVIDEYVREKFSIRSMEQDLDNPLHIYHVIFYEGLPAGYSKIIFRGAHPAIDEKNITKLERIYLLKEFYSLKIGKVLFEFNRALSKTNQDKGIWLYVWKQNKRAIDFYTRMGFAIKGSYDFALTAAHSNPNYLMFLLH